MPTTTYIFNQYYIDLLKKLKTISKKHKSKSETAKRILKTVSDNYRTYDKTSNEYVEFFNEKISNDYWTSFIELENEKADEWLNDDKNNSVEIYKNITLKDIVKVLRNNFLCHHYLSVLYIYKSELKEEDITTILNILQSVENTTEINIEDENIKKVLTRLNTLKEENIKSNPSFAGMDSLKDTTIGKIAKEIIDDVDLTKIKQSISEEGDIFKAIAKPDSGFGELFSNVSQKMSNKISNGELSQEAIMKDVIKFASILPGLFGNGGGEGAAGGKDGFDMAAMMNMMSMMNQGGGGGGKKQRSGVNNEALRSLMKKQQLRQKF